MKPDHPMGTVYFVGAPNGGPIKIGFTRKLEQRLVNLLSWSPFDLTVLASAPGTIDDERAVHAAFIGSRIRCEWFRPTAALLSLIEIVARDIEIPTEFRGAYGQSPLPRARQKRWSAESRAEASRVHRERWEKLRAKKARI